MTTDTTRGFDLAALARAIEERDAAAQLELYDDAAEVTLIDRANPPGSPGCSPVRTRSESGSRTCARAT